MKHRDGEQLSLRFEASRWQEEQGEQPAKRPSTASVVSLADFKARQDVAPAADTDCGQERSLLQQALERVRLFK